jgi:hypothetical protein
MIKDAEKLKQIERQWTTVVLLSNWSQGYAIAGINDQPADEFYNLPLFLAYLALGDFLAQLNLEQPYLPKDARHHLGERMRYSRERLNWRDFNLVNEGRKARNELAREGRLVSKQRCLQYIEGIEAELHAWGIVK